VLRQDSGVASLEHRHLVPVRQRRATGIQDKKVLNHKLQGMLKVYNKHPYEDEKRAALDQWASELRRIEAKGSPVTRLRLDRAGGRAAI
jgi:hypothetical protein